MNNSKIRSVAMPSGLYGELEEYAERVDRKANWVIVKAVREYLDRRKGDGCGEE